MDKAFWSGMIGGMLGAVLVGGAGLAAVEHYGPLRGNGLTLFTAEGRRYLQITKGTDGQSSAVFFMDGKGRSRMELGLYEDGLPSVALEGENHTVKALLRMAGVNQSGVLVFKDKQNRDRMILGLDMSAADEQPFLVTFDPAGHKKVIFGRY